ncbi:DUF6970 domain-containing protein [Tenacibaculum sp. MEBiC06402]|uniref:DUF6970 domain-containing protein n=1 Tax=unclassified Tenacibaculum TaxID=2635139 RepID=UPI003B9AFF40
MKTLLKLVSFLLLVSACTKDEELNEFCVLENPIEELAWLKNIKTGLEQSASDNKVEIYEYSYKQQRVFWVDTCVGCADNLITVYNCSGNVMCEFGGITGVNTCIDFSSEASGKKLLWKNYDQAIINKELYDTVNTDNYVINNILIDGDLIKINISFSGCSPDSDSIKLIDSSAILESAPPRRLLKLEFLKNEACLAHFTRELVFDISNLKIGSTGELIFLFEEWNDEIVYQY